MRPGTQDSASPRTLKLQVFVCASMALYVVFVLSLFVPHISFFWVPGEDCAS